MKLAHFDVVSKTGQAAASTNDRHFIVGEIHGLMRLFQLCWLSIDFVGFLCMKRSEGEADSLPPPMQRWHTHDFPLYDFWLLYAPQFPHLRFIRLISTGAIDFQIQTINVVLASKLRPLDSTAADLQERLSKGTLTSEDLVKRSFAQMDKCDGYLKAIISRAPKALKVARKLDIERKQSYVRGPLHGISILVKDNVATDPRWGVDTTAGSCALKGSRPPGSVSVVSKLVAAGAIIIAKSHLSEFANYKGSDLPPGWSAIGGQTQSAYTSDNVDKADLGFGHSNPGGSSTGSAVGVSAGYAAIAIGTGTTGSVNIPSTRAALYGIRITTGTSDMNGIIPLLRQIRHTWRYGQKSS